MARTARTFLRLAAPLMIVALVATACGSSGDDKKSSSADSTTTTAASPGDTSSRRRPGGRAPRPGRPGALAEAGAKKISLVATQIPQAELSKTFANLGLKSLGLEISQMVLIPPDPSTDFAPYIA